MDLLIVSRKSLRSWLLSPLSHLDYLGIDNGEQVAKGPDAPLLHQKFGLIGLAATRGVADSPGGLLPDVKLSVGEQLDQRRGNVGVNDGLNLVLVSGRDVANSPARLLPDALLWGGEEGEEATEGIEVNNNLGLKVVPGDDVTDGTESGGLDGGGGVEQELDEPPANSSLNDGLDLLIRSIAQVAQGPAGVRKDFLIGAVYKLCKGEEAGLDRLEVRLGLTPAEVAESPGGVPEHGELGVLVKLLKEGLHGTGGKHLVPAWRAVSGDIPKGPDGLFPHIVVRARQQPAENRHSAFLHDDLGVLRSSGGNVGEGPGGLKLKSRQIVAVQKLNEARDNPLVNHLLDGRVLLDTE